MSKGFKKAFDDARERGETRCSVCLSSAHSKEYHVGTRQPTPAEEAYGKTLIPLAEEALAASGELPTVNQATSQGGIPPYTPAASGGALSFQQRVREWTLACFGQAIADDKVERNHRFLEESLELVQVLGCTSSEAHQLVDYVYGRPVGNAVQECGGVLVTLMALCNANGMNAEPCGEDELARVYQKIDLIRAKQAAKPKHSPLSEPAALAAHDQKVREPRVTLEQIRDLPDAERPFSVMIGFHDGHIVKAEGEGALEFYRAMLDGRKRAEEEQKP